MWEDVPDLLHSWRVDVKPNLSLRQAAQRAQQAALQLGIDASFGHTKIAHWETRGPRLNNNIPNYGLVVLDAAYKADGALLAIARALSTPKALEPSWEWAYTFQSPPQKAQFMGILQHDGPVWAWIRPGPKEPNKIDVNVRWGLFRVKISQACDQNGLFLTCPVSTNHPALFVNWNNSPGWVDFGRGQIPAKDLKLNTISVLDVFSIANTTKAINSLWNRYFGKSKNSLSTLAALAEIRKLFLPRSGLLQDVFNRDGDARTPRNLVGLELDKKRDKEHAFSNIEFQELRQNRNLSRQEVANAVNSLSKEFSISEDQIAHLEEGRKTTSKFLISALDMVYGAHGHTFCQSMPLEIQGNKKAIITFPPHWIGTVCLSFTHKFDKTSTGIIGLYWQEWKTSFILSSDTTVTFRKDSTDAPPLKVVFEPNWQVEARIGYCQNAIDVNRNWTFIDEPKIRLSLLKRLISIGIGLGRIPQGEV